MPSEPSVPGVGIGAFARTHPDAVAIAMPGTTVSFAELDGRQRRLVGALHRTGVDVGDRIAVLSTNRPESLEVTTGALRAGIVPVPISPLLTGAEAAFLLEDSGASWLFADRTTELPPVVDQIVTFGDAYERMLHGAKPAELADVSRGRPMHYTSGTTGSPKGVWVAPLEEEAALAAGERFIALWELSEEDVHLVCSPLSHSAPHRFALRTLEAGGTVVLQHRFDAEETLAAIDLLGVTTTFMVPTHLERILSLDLRVRAFDLSSMRLLAHAGAPIREETKRKAIQLFPTGSVWEFYGSTEGVATRISTDEWLERPGSVGRAVPPSRILVRDEQRHVLPAREVGEVWIEDRSGQRFEYWGDSGKTRDAWDGSTFTVGDLGWLDEDGYLFLTGRKHDTIITGGVNVYPQEVEAVLESHPGIKEAMVWGSPDPEWGQRVIASVVAEDGASVDPEALRSWARERLAGFKVPRGIEVVEDLPRTPTGKLRRTGGSSTSAGRG